MTLQELSVLSSQAESISVHSHHTAQLQIHPESQAKAGSATPAQRGISVSGWIRLIVQTSAGEYIFPHRSAEVERTEDSKEFKV